ncbi:hypothetical protein N5079_27110 [Planotetraspora sp. A-T 1434]|uniref:hypothetical protein n=1 Tax=Planotetraspora sp. A-T 1434 TaxID=2979219 RepID=UPI0021C05FE1|nr:hypothetical protein [Planotetraspora sp. A-T 1434]MCT9933889.1 hypothetical protein [Planotetraspora sp. A-T 1434]
MATWDDLVHEAGRALAAGKPHEFQITGQVAELANKFNIPVDTLRVILLTEAFALYIAEVRRSMVIRP